MVEMYVSVDNLNPRRGREISSYKTFRIPPPAVKAAKVRMLKPKASKPKSSEVYMKRYMNKGPGSAQADSHTHTHTQAGRCQADMYVSSWSLHEHEQEQEESRNIQDGTQQQVLVRGTA